ncbi:auxin-responsive protein SAUR50 [Amborella trichopoda]|uniref:SAUR family protein n=1 Tax=Amborella trichopoda TaxID=13333 RepID=U5D2K9_AMBTC|nr:auxin-responsive protein SAUR50 [Amborella trichopoda]ERN19866.1 hypothetical protein AMTR_s00071p00028870 [Amborella trichopoda]|eukprot:XP_006858399.1 auxin-responsive protein SAUR50 [Amborella trichopoda]
MAKTRKIKVMTGIRNMMVLKHLAERIQFGSLQTKGARTKGTPIAIPKDVKEGHFVVLAFEKGDIKRFVVPLGCLRHPAFMRLLEQAEEEFGFNQKGALVIPCHPSELESILSEQWIE